MRVISYYTPRYAEEVDRLIQSCRKFDLDIHTMGLPDRGNWEMNARAKIAVLIWAHLEYMSDSLLWVDADGEFLRAPPPPSQDCDVGVHFHSRGDGRPSPGTILLNPTENTYHFLLAWIERCHGDAEDQSTFNDALDAVPGINLWRMPTEWCYIEGLDMPPEMSVSRVAPIIQQHQASRRLRRRRR